MNSPETAIVVIGGDHPTAERANSLRVRADLIVAADSGYDTCLRLGLLPAAIIGDMDSVTAELPAGLAGGPQVIKWPRNKDYTDTELAIRWAREQGAQRIILLGGGGGRLDHVLGIHALFQRPDAPDAWYTGHDELILIRHYMRTVSRQGITVSFFPAGSGICRARSQGLQWPLDGLSWNNGDCGISNITTANELELHIESGSLAMVRNLGEGDEPFFL